MSLSHSSKKLLSNALAKREVHGPEFSQTFPIFQLAGGRSLRSLPEFSQIFPIFQLAGGRSLRSLPEFPLTFPIFQLAGGRSLRSLPGRPPLEPAESRY